MPASWGMKQRDPLFHAGKYNLNIEKGGTGGIL
jgi:hypothetical protein